MGLRPSNDMHMRGSNLTFSLFRSLRRTLLPKSPEPHSSRKAFKALISCLARSLEHSPCFQKRTKARSKDGPCRISGGHVAPCLQPLCPALTSQHQRMKAVLLTPWLQFSAHPSKKGSVPRLRADYGHRWPASCAQLQPGVGDHRPPQLGQPAAP